MGIAHGKLQIDVINRLTQLNLFANISKPRCSRHRSTLCSPLVSVVLTLSILATVHGRYTPWLYINHTLIFRYRHILIKSNDIPALES